jgi:hypothetical protein
MEDAMTAKIIPYRRKELERTAFGRRHLTPEQRAQRSAMSKRPRRSKNGTPEERAAKAATQEERDALRFKAIKAKFDWTNDDWATTWLPWVRIAAVFVGDNDTHLQEAVRAMIPDGNVPDTLDGLTKLKDHLQSLQ